MIAQRLYDFLGKQSKSTLLALSLVLIATIGLLDYAFAAQHVPIFVLYLFPITAAAWFVSNRAGLAVAVLCALVDFVIDLILFRALPNSGNIYLSGAATVVAYLLAARLLSNLSQQVAREKELARTDYLTGVPNRRAFFEIAENELHRARRYNHVFSTAFIDLDNFKAVNDRFGHQTGDALLRLVAETIKKDIRIVDTVARMGGDEFAILLPEINARQARLAVGRFQTSLLEAMLKRGWPVTFSIGVATFDRPPENTDVMVRLADDLMYSAKRGGKNTIRQEIFG
jgi:diguanylate cyclase (GGDEF)-like protein